MAEFGAALVGQPVRIGVDIVKFSDPVTVWVSNKGGSHQALQELTSMLTAHCNTVDSYRHKAVNPDIYKEKLIAVRHAKKGTWARGLIKTLGLCTAQGDQVEVFLVDTAESLIVPPNWIRTLPDTFKILPPQVQCVKLPGLHPLGLKTVVTSDILVPLKVVPCIEDDWVSTSRQYVKNILREYTAAYVEVIPQESSPLFGKLFFEVRGELYCLNDTLVTEKYAAPCIGPPDCPHRSCRITKPTELLDVKVKSVVDQDSSCLSSSSHSSLSPIEGRERLINDWKAMQRSLDQKFNELHPSEIKMAPMGRGAYLKKILESTKTSFPHTTSSSSPGESNTSINAALCKTDPAQPMESCALLPSSGSQASNGHLHPVAEQFELAEEDVPKMQVPSRNTVVDNNSSVQVELKQPIAKTQVSDIKLASGLEAPKKASEYSLLDNHSALLAVLKAMRGGSISTVTQEASTVAAASLFNVNETRTEVPYSSLPLIPSHVVNYSADQNKMSKEEYRNIFVCGENPVKPVSTLLQTPFATLIKVALAKHNYKDPIFLQYYAWPEVLRARHVVLVGRNKSGKTLGYLLPLLTLLLQRRMYQKTPTGNGPLVLILCSTFESAQGVFRHCQTFAEEEVSVVLVTSSSNEKRLKMELIHGCDIVIATPSRFLEMLKADDGRVTNLTRLCHLIVDDAHVLTEEYTQVLTGIIVEYRTERKKLSNSQIHNCPSQMVLCGETWTPGMNAFVEKFMVDPVVYMTSLIEATIFRHLKVIPYVCTSSTRDAKLMDILNNFKAHRIVICTSDTETAIFVNKLLRAQSQYALIIHGDLTGSEVDQVNREWHTAHSATSHPILIVSDNRLTDLYINNANCLIHYDLPVMSKGLFGDRFSFLLHSLQQEVTANPFALSSHIVITEHCASQASSLVAYLTRLPNTEVPKELVAMAAGRKKGKEELAEELCDSWKAFGRCRQKQPCKFRHTPNLLKDELKVPGVGSVHLLVTCVVDASHYFVRILKHEPEVGKEIDFQLTYWKLSFNLKRYFSKVENRRVADVVKNSDCCGFMEDDNFYRVKVQSKPNEDGMVKVFFMDFGRIDTVPLVKLLKLPPDLQSVPCQAVEVYLCNVMPADNNPKWSIRANTYIARLLKGKELSGQVKYALGKTLWLDPLWKPALLQEAKIRTFDYVVAKTLLSQKFASRNPAHLDLLLTDADTFVGNEQQSHYESIRSCVEMETSSQDDSTSNKSLPEGPFSCDKLHVVFVTNAIQPGLFYVQKEQLDERYEELSTNIDDIVAASCTPGDVITSQLYLAPCPPEFNYCRIRIEEVRDDGNISVFSVDSGEYFNIPKDHMRILPHRYQDDLPFQAVPCKLAGIAPTSGSVWPELAVDGFIKMVLDDDDLSTKLTLKVFKQFPVSARNRKSAQYEVFLYNDSVSDISFNELFVHNNWAVKTLSGPFPDLSEFAGNSLAACQPENAPTIEDVNINTGANTLPTVTVVSKNNLELNSVRDHHETNAAQALSSKQDTVVDVTNIAKQPKQQPSSVAAPIRWHQTINDVTLNVVLANVKTYSLDVSSDHVQFSALVGNKYYSNDLDLYAPINEDSKRITIIGPNTKIVLSKVVPGNWPRLLKGNVKVPWLTVNFDYIVITSDSNSEKVVRLPVRRHHGKSQSRSVPVKPAGFYHRRGASSSTDSDDDDDRGDDTGHDDNFKL